VDALLTAEALLALLALTAMELVLGIDNLVFIVILSGRLPTRQQITARRIGLALALIMRLALLFSITWIMGLTRPLFAVFGQGFSGRDLILLLGGLFLIFKATWEIYDKVEGDPDERGRPRGGRGSLAWVVAQIVLLDVVFSFDSVITAVGMVDEVAVMVTAMIVAVALMLLAMGPLSGFVDRHPSIKLLALAFLLLIGAMLVAEGMGQHVPKGYIYVAMAFSLFVEVLNMRYRRRQGPVRLRRRYQKERSSA
jgi:predicted tellurium resistance membrane protein TerC